MIVLVILGQEDISIVHVLSILNWMFPRPNVSLFSFPLLFLLLTHKRMCSPFCVVSTTVNGSTIQPNYTFKVILSPPFFLPTTPTLLITSEQSISYIDLESIPSSCSLCSCLSHLSLITTISRQLICLSSTLQTQWLFQHINQIISLPDEEGQILFTIWPWCIFPKYSTSPHTHTYSHTCTHIHIHACKHIRAQPHRPFQYVS